MKKAHRFLTATSVVAMCIVASGAHSVAEEKSQTSAPKAKIELSTSPSGLRLNLHYDNADVTDVLMAISKQGNIEVIVLEQVHKRVWNLQISGATPENAIKQVCAAADLDWMVQNKTYVIKPKSPGTAVASMPPFSTVELRDMEIAHLLTFIAEQGNLHVILGLNTFGPKLRYLRLQNETAEGAIQKITQAAGFTCIKLDEKTYKIEGPKNSLR